ncbi:hypothetical protein D3C73_388980 [compost metagenome]
MVVCLRNTWKSKGWIGRIPNKKAASNHSVLKRLFYFTAANADDISLYHRDK